MLLILGGIETNPGEFICVLFLSTSRLKCTKVSERLLVNFEHYAVGKSIPGIRIEKHHNVILSVIFLDKFGIEILRRTCFSTSIYAILFFFETAIERPSLCCHRNDRLPSFIVSYGDSNRNVLITCYFT